MNIQYFEYVVEIDRTRSITQAAENLFMAQPNLSKAIKELEQQIGFSLFERTSKGVIPTKKGEEFLSYARSILKQVANIKLLSQPDDEDVQRFNISIPRGSYISNAFTRFLKTLRNDAGIQVDMEETNAMQTIHDVVSGEYNLGIIRYQLIYENYFLDYLADKKLKSDVVWEFDYVVYMSKNHPLAEVEDLKVEYLLQYTEVSHGDTTIPYLFTEGVEEEDTNAEKIIHVHDRFNQFEILEALPTSYMWGSAVPHQILERYGLIQRICNSKKRKYRDVIIYSKNYKLTKLDLAFIDKLYEAKNEVAYYEHI